MVYHCPPNNHKLMLTCPCSRPIGGRRWVLEEYVEWWLNLPFLIIFLIIKCWVSYPLSETYKLSEKVYCNKCKYYYNRSEEDEQCIHNSNIYFAPSPHTPPHLSDSEKVYKQYKSNPSSLNSNKQCTNYEYSFYHPNKEWIWGLIIFLGIPLAISLANVIAG